MTKHELDRLATLIAEALAEAPRGRRDSWLVPPIRPEPPARGGTPPVWSGAAQSLDDVAPGATAGTPRARVPIAEMTRAVRTAAAGKAPAPAVHATGRVTHSARVRSSSAPTIEVGIGVSNHHVHLSPAHARALFGQDSLSVERPLSQPGQFAAKESVEVTGPTGKIERMRVVGPTRAETQLELALSDCHRLGIVAKVALSGSLADSTGGVTLIGPAGRVTLDRGVIVAARHLHLSPDDAARWGLANGSTLELRCGSGSRAVTLLGVIVRSAPSHATELHLDVDEAAAAGVRTGDRATIIAWREGGGGGKRPLITEREVMDTARNGGALPANAILTPSARDRARALGMLPG